MRFRSKLSIFTVSIVLIFVFVIGQGLDGAYVVPVIMYHSINQDHMKSKLSVSPESFQRQMEFLKRRHYNVVSLDTLTTIIREKRPIPPKTLAITFDDGYENVYKDAFPVLKKYNLPATVFIITDWTDRQGFMNWSQIKEMSDSGIDIGGHTITHSWLPTLSSEELEKEVVNSKKEIERQLKKPVNFFCYPMGRFDSKVRQKVIDAGYKGAVTTNPGAKYPRHDIYAMKRIRISRSSDNLVVFWIETSGYYTWIKEHRYHRGK